MKHSKVSCGHSQRISNPNSKINKAILREITSLRDQTKHERHIRNTMEDLIRSSFRITDNWLDIINSRDAVKYLCTKFGIDPLQNSKRIEMGISKILKQMGAIKTREHLYGARLQIFHCVQYIEKETECLKKQSERNG